VKDKVRDLRSRWEEATSGRTGIACFDQWTDELLDTGYLHNHARMWFSSIWIFTLRLPWELGADFSFRLLKGGDCASNTLSSRWVAGLRTCGRTYLARPDNIAKFTAGRFEDIRELADEAVALLEPAPEPPMPLPKADPLGAPRPVCLLIGEDDCDPLSLGLLFDGVRAAAGVTSTHQRSPLPAGALPATFLRGAVSDTLGRIYDALQCPTTLFAADAGADDLVDWARSAEVGEIVALYLPVGPTWEWLSRVRRPIAYAGIRLITVRRERNMVLWPYATKGFFRFREPVPAAFRNLGIG
jgi:deoxyribodipyrimidine photo-lyase